VAARLDGARISRASDAPELGVAELVDEPSRRALAGIAVPAWTSSARPARRARPAATSTSGSAPARPRTAARPRRLVDAHTRSSTASSPQVMQPSKSAMQPERSLTDHARP
jgi:hypothetical protein